jgi:hypothetical protein
MSVDHPAVQQLRQYLVDRQHVICSQSQPQHFASCSPYHYPNSPHPNSNLHHLSRCDYEDNVLSLGQLSTGNEGESRRLSDVIQSRVNSSGDIYSRTTTLPSTLLLMPHETAHQYSTDDSAIVLSDTSGTFSDFSNSLEPLTPNLFPSPAHHATACNSTHQNRSVSGGIRRSNCADGPTRYNASATSTYSRNIDTDELDLGIMASPASLVGDFLKLAHNNPDIASVTRELLELLSEEEADCWDTDDDEEDDNAGDSEDAAIVGSISYDLGAADETSANKALVMQSLKMWYTLLKEYFCMYSIHSQVRVACYTVSVTGTVKNCVAVVL